MMLTPHLCGNTDKPAEILTCSFEEKMINFNNYEKFCSKTISMNENNTSVTFLSPSFHQVRHSRVVFLCLRANEPAETNLSLCGPKCHNHATEVENIIHIVVR